MEPRDVHARRWRRLRDVGVSLILSVTVAAVRAQGPARKDAARARHSPPWQRVLTGDDAQRVKALEKTVDELEKQGQFAEAMAPAREGLAIRQRVQGEDHWQTIEARITVQTWQRVAGLPPGDQSDLAAALRQQEEADQLYEKGRYAELEPLVRTIWEVHRRILGAEHPYTAVRANNLAAYLRARGRYAEAEPLLEQVLAIRRKTLGREHPFTALSCNNLAMVLEAQGKFAESEHLFQEALAIRRQTLGDDHPVTASSYDNLAYNWHALGKLAEAEPLLRKALTIRRKALGEDHPLLAYSYNNLAANLDARGKSAEAEPLFQRALEIRRKVLGEDHPDTASSYENLAINRHYQGKSAEAEPLLQQALRIRLKVLGADHPDTAQSYSELAAHLDDRRKYAEAEPLHQRALAIRRTRLGEGHPKTALSYHNLALSLDDRGQHSQAGRLFGQALAIRRKALGEDHPDTARSYSSLAANLHSQGKFAEADVMAIAAAGSFEAARPRISFTGMDRAEFSARSSPLPLLAALLVRQGRDQDAWQRWESGLARGLFDDLTARRRRPLTPEERGRQEDLIGQLNRLDNQIGALAAASTPADDQLKRLDSLKDRRLELQGRLAQFEAGLVQKYKVAAGAVYSLDPIQTRLPADAALVGWLDLRTLPQSSDPRGDHWACVVRRSGTPRWVRIPGTGPNQAWTAADDQQPGQVRALLGRSDVPPCQAPLAAMAAQRLAPLEPTLSARDDLPAVRHLIVLPSPALAGVPVEALLAARPSEAPNYLVSYAPSGTLFAWLQERREDPGAPVRSGRLLALGDPMPPPPEEPTPPTPRPHPPVAQAILAQRAADALLRRSRGATFERLPGTRREVQALASLFDQSEIHLGSDASEQTLEALRANGQLSTFTVIHLATHGKIDDRAPMNSRLLLAQDRLPDPTAAWPLEVPVVDGVLTAGEVLNTWKLHAELVTLSACQSGLGRQGGGEGFIGFAQAFFLAGARSLVVSLWEVNDQAASLLMSRFYQNWLGKRPGLDRPLSKAEAMREARDWLRGLTGAQVERELTAIARGELQRRSGPLPAAGRPFAHPHYWAGFILMGDPN